MVVAAVSKTVCVTGGGAPGARGGGFWADPRGAASVVSAATSDITCRALAARIDGGAMTASMRQVGYGGKETTDWKELKTAPNAERRQMPNGARCQTAREPDGA
jgi:hypothetical protein